MENFAGRVAVVTGAASGIGLAMVEAFLELGMRVVMADVNGDLLRREQSRLLDGGAEVDAAVTDVSDPEAVDRLGRQVVDAFGQLNVAVNNAGIVRSGSGGSSWELSVGDWQRVLDINLWGVIHGIRTFVPLILETGEEGHVVNTASLAAVTARAGLGPYTVSKHGVLGLSDVLRAELRERGAPVGVSVVMPGRIRTGMNPIGTVSAATVAENVVDAMRRDRPYVFTDDHSADEVESRLHEIIAARDEVVVPR